jgi:PAS domain S-box-containing protein
METRDPADPMRRSRERMAQLLTETAGDAHGSKEHLQRLVQEMAGAIEELMVAEEELQAQAEQLAASTEAIDAERERYGELFDFAPDAYLVTDEQGKVLEANQAASNMLAVPARYLEGKLLVSFVANDDRRAMRDLVRFIASHGDPVEEQYVRLQPRGGEPFVAAVRAASRRSSRHDAGAVRWMIRDITQRIQLEEEVRFLHSEVDLLTSLAQVSQLTEQPEPPEKVLERAVRLAAQALPGCDVSLTLQGERGARLAAASGDAGTRLEEVERRQGDGPGLLAMRQEAPVEITLAEVTTKWPVFAAEARALKVQASVGHPLVTLGGRRGALNVHAFTPMTPQRRDLIPLLADQVAVALSNAELYEGAHGLATHLRRALESRGVIEQAKGVLIAREGCSDDEAFDMLRRASQRMNRKLRDVAADLVSGVQRREPATQSPAHPASTGQPPT